MPLVYEFCLFCCVALQTIFANSQIIKMNTQQFQIISIAFSKCNANQVFIEDNCFNCHFSCLTCKGLGNQQCQDCNVVNHRILINFECLCQPYYYEFQNQSTCLKCHNLCQNCFGGSSNECLSCQDGYQLISHTCLCEPQKYFNKDNMDCEYCSFSCDSCKGPLSTDCLSCSENSLRIFKKNECICPEGYYSDSSNKICQKCHLNCQTCSSFTECLSCSNNKFLNGFNCICKNGFMMDITSQKCYQCHKTCLTCTGQLFTNCLNCPINSILSNNRCTCSDGYFENYNGCLPCNQNCLTCEYSATNCLVCKEGFDNQINMMCCKQTNILIGDLCGCLSNEIMNTLGKCEECPSHCATCSSQSFCTECIQPYTGDVCDFPCSIPNSVLCTKQNKCQTCHQDYDCDSSGNCICKANRYSQTNVCKKCDIQYNPGCIACNSTACTQCSDGYYLSGSLCSQCSSNCQICSSNASCSKCLSQFYGANCSNFCHYTATINQNNQCQCSSQYYFDTNQICQPCSTRCDNCQNQNNQCLGCFQSQNRVLMSTSCDCKPGYEESGFDTCQMINCKYGCMQCTNIGTSQYSCSSCLTDGTHRQNNSALNCPCLDGFYNANQLICLQCPYFCATCLSSSVCVTCTENRNIKDNCKCKQGYFESGQTCQPCSLNCMNCLAETKCVKCQNENFNLSVSGYCECFLNNFVNQSSCQCLAGYYLDKKNFKCLPCNYKCKTCKFNAFNCQTCSDSHYNPPMCSCSPGFYMEKNVDNLMDDDFSCLPCKNNCFLCKSEKECLDCSDQMILLNNKCVCQPGYYNEINSYNCLSCSSQCEECKFHQNNCLKCNFNRINPQICQCPQGTYEVDITQPCEICLQRCKSCESSADNCLECSLNREIPPTCQCQDGYFEDINEECQLCNSKCQTCSSNSSNCTQCSQIGALIPNCQCLDGYFFSESQGCIKCIDRCLTCIGPYEYNCLSCDQSKFLKLLYNKCVCEQNYYYQDNQCNICTIDVEACQTNYCGDGIKQLHEQCDDWNNNNRDGCSDKCIIENEYYCELVQNFQLHSTIIYTQCIKCLTNCSQCDKNKCLQCYSEYFLTNTFDCQKCNFHCKECQGPNQKDCISCKSGYEYGFKEKCAFCEEYQGLYTFGDKCISKCGDGIKRKDEQCDDGNTINKDGCSTVCKIEEDWGCSDQENTLSTCYKLNIPIAILKFDRAKDFYQNIRKGEIIFNKPMVISNSFSVDTWKQNLSNHNFGIDYNIISTLILNQKNTVESIFLEINLLQSIDKIKYQIDFTSYLIKDSIDGYYLRTKQLQADLGRYFKQSVQTITTTKTSKKFATSVLFILGGVVLLGFIIGSLEFYWNILDNLQILSYFTFVNVNFPFMHNQFLSIFSFARFEFTNDYFNFDLIKNLDFSKNQDYPLFYDKQVESNLVINISSTAFIWLAPICLLLISKINLFIIQNCFINKLKLQEHTEIETSNFKFVLLKIIYFIHSICLKYQQNFFYKILIRIYISSLYDLNFSIFTALYCWLWNNNPNLIDYLLLIVSISLILLQIFILFLFSPSLKVQQYQISTTKYAQRFGALYEGVKLTKQINRQIQFLQPVRKILFMGSLILLYDYPLFQIAILVSIQILSSIMLISANYYLNILETIKGIIQDVSLSLSLSLILFYYAQDIFNIVQQETVEMLSYLHVGIYCLMLCTCLIIDLFQQFRLIVKKNSFIKKIIQLCNQQSSMNKSQIKHTQKIFLDLNLIPQQINFEQQSNQKLNQNNNYVFTNLKLY